MSRRTWSFVVALILAGVLSAGSVLAQEASSVELKKEMQALSDAVKAMQQDLREIKALLQRRGPPALPENVLFHLGSDRPGARPPRSSRSWSFRIFNVRSVGRHVSETDPLLTKDYRTSTRESSRWCSWISR